MDNNRTTANLLLASAGVAAAYVILTTPPLRRLTFRLARFWLGVAMPTYLAGQLRQAWLDSGERPRTARRVIATNSASINHRSA